jgi:bifunctional non-homologous end joining protein LigD
MGKSPKPKSRRPPAQKRTARRPTRSKTRGQSKRATSSSDVQSSDYGLPELPFEPTNLGKIMFPRDGYTKGDLFRYYVQVAPEILPVILDRALALKRYPNGVGAPYFFQQNAPPAESRPREVRVESVRVTTEGGSLHPRIIGGTLPTLLYTVQLGCIEVNPWLARLQSLDNPDYSVIDLDPAPGLPFERTVEIATWVHDVLESLGLNAVPKTTGSRGIHVFIPLPPKTSGERAFELAHLVANRVVAAHPRVTTVERDLKSRPPRSVYIDFVQNARGKTVAAAYSVRPVDGARVSTPLAWAELKSDLDHARFTLKTVPARVAQLGDLWAEGLARRNSPAAVRDAVGKA